MIKIEKSTLYVVATPIGNLGDITLRALEILKSVDTILAEDTRETGKLLAGLNIRNTQKLISCHDFNESERIDQTKELLNEGQSIALVSDAGTPLISDPGYKIVNALRNKNFNIVPIPGVSAVVTALSVAGLPSDNFTFRGFLATKKAKRQEQILAFSKLNSTVVVYESVHRVSYLLADLVEILPEHNIVVAKEITKQFEKFVSGKPSEVQQFFMDNSDTVRGEFVVLIDCSGSENDKVSITIDLRELLVDLLENLPLKRAVKLVTKLTKGKKNEIYEIALEIKDS